MNKPPSKTVNMQTGIKTTVTIMRHRWLRMTATIAAHSHQASAKGQKAPCVRTISSAGPAKASIAGNR